MEFTLEQLTPDNLKMLFEQAFFEVSDVVQVRKDDDGDITGWGSIFVKEDGSNYRIMPAVDAEFIQFSYTLWHPANDLPAADVLLKVSNAFDRYPVHCHYQGVDDDGDVMIQMIYSQIFPTGGQIEAKKLIKIFKTFVKLTQQNLRKLPNAIRKYEKED